jgi:hypothetical protein
MPLSFSLSNQWREFRMSEETTLPNQPGKDQRNTTPAYSHVCNKAPLSPQEIESINKAFLKLLLAKETHTNGNSNKSNTDISAKKAR